MGVGIARSIACLGAGHNMTVKTNVKAFVASGSLEPVRPPNDPQGPRTIQFTADRELGSSHEIGHLMLIDQDPMTSPLSQHIPAGARVVMLPVLVVTHEGQPDAVGRERSIRSDPSGTGQGGAKPAVCSIENSKRSRSERSRYVYGALVMDISRREVLVDGQEVGLTRREFDLLECLLRHPGHVRSRDALLNVAWGDEYYGTTRTVDVHIRRLKKKIPLLDCVIVSVRGLGYKLKDSVDHSTV